METCASPSAPGVMNEFKSGRANILVATDVAARGIDVDDIEAVFNYDIPAEYEHYIHRIGRTGRAGKEGKSLSLVSNRAQVLQIQNIQNYIGAPIVLKQLPQAEDILNKNREKLVNKLKAAYHEPGAQRYTGLVQRLISEGYDPMQLVCAAVLLGDKKAQRPIPHIPTASFGGGKTAKALNGAAW